MSLEDAFARLHGRAPSDEERARFARFREAFGLGDNDAFWCILLALDHYDGLFARYPEKLALETSRVLADADAAIAATIRRELSREADPKDRRAVTVPVHEPPATFPPNEGGLDVADAAALRREVLAAFEAARAGAPRPPEMNNQHRDRVAAGSCAEPLSVQVAPLVVAGVGALLVFGSLCMAAGFTMADKGSASWLQGGPAGGALARIVCLLLRAPAGWMLFALLLPVGAYGIRAGWSTARDHFAEAKERAFGWGLLGLSLLGMVACALLLARIL